MSLDAKHPLYSEKLPDWVKLQDSYAGQRKIKEKRTTYLPATSGMEADGMETNNNGYKAYNAYLMRAVYHNFIKGAVETSVGVMHQKEAVIDLPESMEPLRDSITLNGESILSLLRTINAEQLKTGRLGLLADLPENPTDDALPYITTYMAEHIINWDKGSDGEFAIEDLTFVVLDESGFRLTIGFEWETEKRYRALKMVDGVFMTGLFRERDGNLIFDETQLIAPSVKGKTLDKIPFVFINSKDTSADPSDPPLLDLAELSLAIYLGEADYRQSLFLQGQDTLVISGGQNSDGTMQTRVGSGATIHLPMSGTAEYIGVDSKGLSEQRNALENDKTRATQLGGSLIESVAKERQSGEALKTKIAAQTATLNQIALTGAGALEAELKIIAIWIGANPDEVSVIPNLDFAVSELEGKALLDLMSAKMLGAPLSQRSIHELMQKKELTERTFEEELEEIEGEDDLSGGEGTGEVDER